MFGMIKSMVKYMLFIVFVAAFVLFLCDERVSAFLNNPFVLYGLMFLIVLLLVITAFMVGLPSFEETKNGLLDYLDKIEKQANSDKNGDQSEE
ncbi:MAG: hypothetical protein GY804_13440 [Alphaproteobacteria bacterium]|nr:hypothetical protein [Alphaproteobacteria bacterium]